MVCETFRIHITVKFWSPNFPSTNYVWVFSKPFCTQIYVWIVIILYVVVTVVDLIPSERYSIFGFKSDLKRFLLWRTFIGFLFTVSTDNGWQRLTCCHSPFGVLHKSPSDTVTMCNTRVVCILYTCGRVASFSCRAHLSSRVKSLFRSIWETKTRFLSKKKIVRNN